MPSSKHPFGSVEYYAAYFSDVICDANEDLNTAMNILKGFQMAVEDWIDYHDKSTQNYEQLLKQFLNINV